MTVLSRTSGSNGFPGSGGPVDLGFFLGIFFSQIIELRLAGIDFQPADGSLAGTSGSANILGLALENLTLGKPSIRHFTYFADRFFRLLHYTRPTPTLRDKKKPPVTLSLRVDPSRCEL